LDDHWIVLLRNKENWVIGIFKNLTNNYDIRLIVSFAFNLILLALVISLIKKMLAKKKINRILPTSREVNGVGAHSLGLSAEGPVLESRPKPRESIKLFSLSKLIPSTRNSTNVNSVELHL
jgi:hypothetical protein